ncbi:MAG: chemotaxis protein CheW [Chloroflexi bacterium]|nr:chemotaxis protein CheW [Chloroflexota bacterium]
MDNQSASSCSIRDMDASVGDRVGASKEKSPADLFIFSLGAQSFAFSMNRLIKVVPARTLVPTLGSTESLVGAIRVFGESIPVVSMRHYLGFPESGIDPLAQILLMSARNSIIGLLVDRIYSVAYQPEKSKCNHYPPGTIVSTPSGPALILDFEHLFSDDRLQEMMQGVRDVTPIPGVQRTFTTKLTDGNSGRDAMPGSSADGVTGKKSR